MRSHPATSPPAIPVSSRPSPLSSDAENQDQLRDFCATAARPLENIANNLARAGQRPDPREERWIAREVLWSFSTLPRVRTCGRWSVRSDGSVDVRANGAAVGFAGLATCGSVWACPVCNAKVQAVRRLEVESTSATVLGDGGGAAFGAYTVAHHAGAALDPTWRSLSLCWEAVGRDKTVRSLRSSLGIVGTVRAAEVTHGVHGWHPHLHPLHLFARPVSGGDVARLHAAQERAWIAAACRLGLSAPSRAAQHLHAVSGDVSGVMADYFAKATFSAAAVGWELTSTQTKTATRAKGATPWDLLHAVHRHGDGDALALWQHYEAGSKGKRALTWSRGLRAAVGLDREASDEEVASAELGSDVDTGFRVLDWSPVRQRPVLGARLLAVIDQGRNWPAGRRFCRSHGIAILSDLPGRAAA